MKLLSLLDTIGTATAASGADDAATSGPAGRRAVLRRAAQAGGAALTAALPLLSALPAAARPTETVLDSLTLLLALADLQQALYTKALATAGLVPPAARPGLVQQQQQQQQQAAFLRSLFVPSGVPEPAVPTFDFSGSRGGQGPVLFPEAFVTFAGFLNLAQPLADAAARVYLGQFTTLRTNAPLLGAVVRRQPVEARHAAHLRTLRRNLTTGTLPKSWPSTTDAALPPALATLLAGEENELQVIPGVTNGSRYINFYALFTESPVQTTALSEAFDEPLPTEQAAALLALFQ